MSYVYTAGELAQAIAKPDYTGGTYAVAIAPNEGGGVVFHDYVFPGNGRFAVGGGSADGARVFPADLSRRPGDRGVGVVARALIAMAKRASVVGAWRDAQGRLWIDEVDTYSHVGDALRVALERGELAVWDGREGEEIPLDLDLREQYLAARVFTDVDLAAVEERAAAGQS